ncbi:soluble calcium-activated nucleotidase 1 [Agrilus planipennis]|uniref:Apyrase n=1 Tax=Agrilus planipennis TaxID=224129 RepID=A0A1W4X9M1_AGRPL|nr:soluble calcium-activated nucleotidase 1 [Agrilus planipennis]
MLSHQFHCSWIERLLSMTPEEVEMGTKDWRKALKSQPTYRIVNRTLRGQTHFVGFVAVTGVLLLIVLYSLPKQPNSANCGIMRYLYNHTYPLTPVLKSGNMYIYRIGIIADLDTNSRNNQKNMWVSYYKKGYLSFDHLTNKIVVSWDAGDPIKLTTSYALKGRGMELSELAVFDGRLLTFDDRTGMVFEIVGNNAIPWVILLDGDGKKSKGFKSEWATVRNELLYVGSMGKEWTTPSGEFESNDPQYVKVIAVNGLVQSLKWVDNYERLREILGIHWPGYMIHESGVWSEIHEKWFFLPRRCSKDPYNETLDEYRGCSWLISADSNFYRTEATQIPTKSKTRGFSSFKFIPDTDDSVIVALRTEELNGSTSTYITVFTITGTVYLDDTYISNVKYEGLEFV